MHNPLNQNLFLTDRFWKHSMVGPLITYITLLFNVIVISLLSLKLLESILIHRPRITIKKDKINMLTLWLIIVENHRKRYEQKKHRITIKRILMNQALFTYFNSLYIFLNYIWSQQFLLLFILLKRIILKFY